MTFVTTAHLQKTFGLPRALAAEIVADGTRHALLHRWQPWLWLLVSLGIPALALGLGWTSWQALRLVGVFVLIVAMTGWHLLAQRLAGDRMLAAAADKARRIGSTGSGS